MERLAIAGIIGTAGFLAAVLVEWFKYRGRRG
jgi:hypothetical protein